MPSRNVVSVSLTDDELAELDKARTLPGGPVVGKAAFIRFALADFIERRRRAAERGE